MKQGIKKKKPTGLVHYSRMKHSIKKKKKPTCLIHYNRMKHSIKKKKKRKKKRKTKP